MFLALVMCLGLVQVTAFAEEETIDDPALCEHVWNNGEITQEATCAAAGVKTFTCTVEGCGETRTETIPAAAHTPEVVEAVAPTETQPGLTEGSRCLVCGETLTAQELIPATGVAVPTEFLNAVEALRELDDPAALLAGVEAAEALYNDLTEAQKALPEVAQCKAALEAFRQVMTLEDEPDSDEDPDVIKSGKWYDITWKLTKDGVLTIEGDGQLNGAAWGNNIDKSLVKSVVFTGKPTNLPGFSGQNDGYVNLEKISIPGSVGTIPGGALRGCTKLKEVEIGEGVTVIEGNTFIDCSSLETITFPSTLEEIHNQVFLRCTSLKNVTIPEAVKEIRFNTFQGCTALETVEIKGSTNLGKNIFEGCSALTSVTMAEGTTFGEYAFVKCSKLANVTLPSDIKEIPQYAFSECTALEKVEIPATVEKIGKYAFKSNAKLKNVSIPQSVTEIGAGAFLGTAIEAVTIPSGVTEISNSVFYLTALKEVTIPSTVKKIGESAFQKCSQLSKITIENGVETIGQSAFAQTALAEVIIPDSVKSIGNLAFCDCSQLEEVVLPNGLTTIGQWLFQNCGSLKSLTIPESVTEIQDKAFRRTTGMPLIQIPDSVTTIGEHVFVTDTSGEAFVPDAENGKSILGSVKVLHVVGAENKSDVAVFYVMDSAHTEEIIAIKDGIVGVLNGGNVTADAVPKIKALATPTKTGATFAGWYETADFSGSRVTGDTAEAGKVYYARWCTAHQWDGGVMTTAPTYTSEGVMTYTCTVCGTPRTESIGRLTYVDPYFPTFTPTYPTGGGTGTTTPPSTITDNPTPLDPGTTITDDETPLDRLPLLFRDVADDMWYRDAVAYVFDRGLMKGINETTFAPSLSTERGMIVTILHRLEGEPNAAASAFTDVAAGEWYTDAVAWGAANGVVKGYSDTIFKPTQDITREQLAAILYRYAQLKGYDTSKRADLSVYTDAGDISAYALEAMQWAVAEELISGVTSYTLVPSGRADRAQVAMILMRFCERIVPAE